MGKSLEMIPENLTSWAVLLPTTMVFSSMGVLLSATEGIFSQSLLINAGNFL